MVGSRNPTGFKSLLPGSSDQYILNGIIQHMAHMQFSRHIGRGNNNSICFLIRVRLGIEIALFFPGGIPFLLDQGGLKLFWDLALQFFNYFKREIR